MGGFAFKRPAFPTADFGGDCIFSIITTLVQPQIHALNKVHIGDKLRVRLSPMVRALEVVNQYEDSCGLIIPKFARLASCMSKGIEFEAIVISLDGAACNVLIQNIK
jgi:hypothetical protein